MRLWFFRSTIATLIDGCGVCCLVLLILYLPISLASQWPSLYLAHNDSLLMREVVDFLFHGGTLRHFNAREMQHLQDVKSLLAWSNTLTQWLVGILLLYGLARHRPLTYYIAGWLGLSIQSILMIFALWQFDTLFYLFHALLFPPGSWIFPADSALIRTFPKSLFVTVGISCLAVSVICYAIVIILSRCYLQRSRNP